MKKGLLLSAIILWTLVAVAAVGIIVFGINGGFSNTTKSGTLIKSEDIPVVNIHNIIVEGRHQAIEICKTEGSSVKVKQYGKEKTDKEDLFAVSVSDDSVHISINQARRFGFFDFLFIVERLVVEIPESFMGNLDAKTSSGGVKTEDEIVLENIVLKSSSGGIRFYGTVAAKNLQVETKSGGISSEMAMNAEDSIELKSSSGGIKLRNTVTAKYLNAKTNSGGLRLGDVNVQTYYLKSSSGGISAESISGEGEASTSSGRITLSLRNPTGDINLSSSSGGINLAIEPSLQFTLDAQTSSGGIRTNFPTAKNEKGNKATAKIGDNPTVNIIANTNSGNIRVEE